MPIYVDVYLDSGFSFVLDSLLVIIPSNPLISKPYCHILLECKYDDPCS